MVSKDKKQIKIALPVEMVEVMESAIKKDKSGHHITKSDIIITALSMLFGLAEKRANQQSLKDKSKKEDA